MKILVTKHPDTPGECLFSEFEPRGNLYFCTLKEYIPPADNKSVGYKPKCICKNTDRCTKLCVGPFDTTTLTLIEEE